MTYSGIQMFMEKLKQLINCNDNPLINHPAIVYARPQFQLLHEELGSITQTLFTDKTYLPELNDHMKKMFKYAVEEAQSIVDLFLSGVHLRNTGQSSTSDQGFNRSLNLDDVIRSLESIKVEFMSLRVDRMKTDSSSEKTLLNQAAAAAPRNSLGSKWDEIIVGIYDDAELIRDKLVEDQRRLDVVSIVGMGGLGKTTLATKVFNDRFIMHHFHVRVWVTVSQTYDQRDVLIQILNSIHDQLHLGKAATDSKLREMVHKHLIGKRYLIVIDDIWHTETWDKVKLFFIHDNARSRILLTTRLTEVAKHANPNGFIHHLRYMNKEKSWELLCQKLFHDNELPEWSIKPGMQIVEKCKGLPLSVVVIAGILAKEARSEEWWEEIAYTTSQYIVGDQNGCLEILTLSYNHLPFHMRDCFLYFGGFPEDHTFHVKRLIWLWVAEGFIEDDGSGSLEDIAESYLMDLIDRNLVIVTHRRKSSGAARACKVHDLVRVLCLKKAKEEGLLFKIERLILTSHFSNVITPLYEPVRMFINNVINILGPSTQNLRSILLFSDFKPLSDGIAKYFCSFMLLRVLDLRSCSLNDFPSGMELLVHLRYLAIWIISQGFPSSVCNLWGLQTLIYSSGPAGQDPIVLPMNISNLVNLRHLRIWSLGTPFYFPTIEKPMNLRTILNVVLHDEVGNFQKCFPYIKEHRCCTSRDEECDFKSLTCLEKLKLANPRTRVISCITFPKTLRALTLHSCQMAWSHMSIIQSLPNLQFLKLKHRALEGSCSNTDGQEFQRLTFLRLEGLNIKEWEACTLSFPCLRQLEIYSCKDLKCIPLEIGDISTLELIRINDCNDSVNKSVKRIQEEQNDLGNFDLVEARL